MNQFEQEIRALLQAENIEFIEMSQHGSGSRLLLRVIADRRIGGLSIDDCVHLTRQIQYLIGERNLLPNEYRLEVSSPGLDLPLRESWQFVKNVGRLLKLRVPGARGPKEIHGRLQDANDSGIKVTDGALEYQLAYTDLLSATVLPELNTNPAKGKRAKETQR